jgi:hypothetical protein
MYHIRPMKLKAQQESNTCGVFDGVLERIDSEGIAHVTFTNPEGKTATAEIKATQLTSRGIRELDRFQCEIKATPESIILTMFPLPSYQPTYADYLKIQEDLDKVIPDSPERDSNSRSSSD